MRVRLVNAEGDGLPGLVADRYADAVVVKLTTAGMLVRREAIAAALRAATGAAIGFERADSVAARKEGLPARQGPLWGEPPVEPVWIRERGRRYRVDLARGTEDRLLPRSARRARPGAAAGGGPPGARPVLLHGRLRRRRGVRRRPAPHAGRFLGPRARARAGESRGERGRRTGAARAGRRLRVPARGRRGLRPPDPGSAADGAGRARRRARCARLQGSVSKRAEALGAARVPARLRLLAPHQRREAAPDRLRRLARGPSQPARAGDARRRARSRRLARPSGGRLSLRPAARGVSGIAEARARAARFVAEWGDEAALRRASVLVGAEPLGSASSALESWAERAGVFPAPRRRGSPGGAPRARRARGPARPRLGARPPDRGGAGQGAGRGRILRRSGQRRGGARVHDGPPGGRSLGPALGAKTPARPCGGLPGRALHAGARGGIRLAPARRLHAALHERRARARRRRAPVVRPRARARIPGPTLRRRADGADLGRLRSRGAARREGRRGRDRARAAGRAGRRRKLADPGRGRPRRARAARPRRAHRPGAPGLTPGSQGRTAMAA